MNAEGTAGTAAFLDGARVKSGPNSGFLSHSLIPAIAVTVTIVPQFLIAHKPLQSELLSEHRGKLPSPLSQRAKRNVNHGPWIWAGRRQCEKRECYNLQIGNNMQICASWVLLAVLQD